MSILVFDLKGRMAHFRKFDTNSSSLTYTAPPRTVISGLIAGVLGFEKDSYYHLFSCEHANIAVSIRLWPRKIMQTINYMFVKTSSHLNNSGGHTQIPLEFLLPHANYQHVEFRIYFQHNDKQLQDELEMRIKRGFYVYPPYLGLTEMLGTIIWIGKGECRELVLKNDDHVKFQSIVPVNKIKERSIISFQSGDQYSYYQKEKMPHYFDKNRFLVESTSYLMEKSGNITACPNGVFWKVHYNGIEENIMFM